MASGSTMTLSGRIEKTDIPTLLRSVEKDKNSGELSFNRNNDRVDLYFLFGQLYHAKWREHIGVDALKELLSWSNGNYSFTEGIIPAQASINEDIEKILADQEKALPANSSQNERRSAALPPRPVHTTPPPSNHVSAPATYNSPAPVDASPVTGSPSFASPEMGELLPFDLASLDSMNEVFPEEPSASAAVNHTPERPVAVVASGTNHVAEEVYSAGNGRVAPTPPAGGLYRTRLFCLPTGEQMATSLVATGPQLEEELMHLAEVRFTGYVLGGPEINGLPTVGICLLRGRFIHAFYHINGPSGLSLVEGEKAYRTALDQGDAGAARFYWFYELTTEAMRAAIALLTPPTRYVHLEVRIIRFKELLRLLNEEGFTGTIRITIPAGAVGLDRNPSNMAGERAYIPIYQGNILGLWTENSPRLTNDGQLLQRFLNEPQAYLDLQSTTPVAEPGMPLETLVATNSSQVDIQLGLVGTGRLGEISTGTARQGSTGNLAGRSGYAENPSPNPAPMPVVAVPVVAEDESLEEVDDDERQIRLISSISRMESTWTQMQKKDRVDDQTMLLALAGFANEVLSLNEGVSGRRGVQEIIQRSMRQELMPYRTIFQMLELGQGRINISKLLREYDLFSRDNNNSAEDFLREASRGLRTLLRSTFQYYVSMIRVETIRFECQEMYEVFLQDVVRKM
ncbi:MAG TPA: DUF4388 domain-containing protein [Chloroflexia bacterium]|nr:DUF4388 domain-containing protein [Chloroflexia bacterium]